MESDGISNESFNAYFADKTVQLVDGLKDNINFSGTTGDLVDASRLHKELKALRRGLPADIQSSIFIATDSVENMFMKALLSGSAETPYAHGIFEFDIRLPQSYPNSPPEMRHITSIQSGVGFGPNLYNNGYVCLSLIDTWPGDSVESWSPDKNLLQILISIQSLVMEDNIINKEPGCEDFYEDTHDNIIFQNIVKVATIRYAMISPLQNPPFGYQEVIKNYFRLKRGVIIESVNKWLEDAANQKVGYSFGDMAYGYNEMCYEEIAHNGYFKVLREAAQQLRDLLNSEFGGELPELMNLSEEDLNKLMESQRCSDCLLYTSDAADE